MVEIGASITWSSRSATSTRRAASTSASWECGEVEFSGGRRALPFGPQKINLHEQDREVEPHARRPTPGSADL